MPRVTERYIQARRAEIMAAARRRFARDGFHATTMDDVVAEAGLSSSVVYRWFRGKDELVTACVSDTMNGIAARVRAELLVDPPMPLREALRRILLASSAGARESGTEITALALQSWAESLRNPAIRALTGDFYRDLWSDLAELVGRHQAAGTVDPGLDPINVARAVLAFLPGYLVQHLMLDPEDDPDPFVTAVSVLLPDRVSSQPG